MPRPRASSVGSPVSASAARRRDVSREETAVPSHACPIDLVHLSCIAMGDKALERDVLHAYATQAPIHRRALLSKDADAVRRAAHMLLGSSRAVGAQRVAAAAKTCEADTAATPALVVALDEALAFIEGLRD